MIISNGGDKSCFFLVLSGQGYLMVALEGVKKTHSGVSDGRIYQSVYPWHGEGILRAGLVEVREVYADPPFLALFLYHDCVG